MRYDEFRDQLQGALRQAGLFDVVGRPAETIDVSSAGRDWKAHLLPSPPPSTEPFHVSSIIAFNWSPLAAARAHTNEEDLLTELLGRRQRFPRTARRLVRVDLELHADLPYGSTSVLPEAKTLNSWADTANREFGRLFADVRERQGQIVAVLGAGQEISFEVRCGAGGVLSLEGFSLAGFRLIRVPRVWDDPGRRDAESGSSPETVRLAGLFKNAVDLWCECVAELARWIRYTPPPPEARPVEPSFEEDGGDEEDCGPEIVH